MLKRSRGDNDDLRVALIGHPVGHSRSAQLFAAQAAQGGVPVQYELIDTPADALSNVLARLRAGVWQGINVTVPHKGAVAAACDRLDPVARASGAVNVVRREADGSLSGFNTDGIGFLEALAVHLPEVHASLRPGATVLLLGAGGAARGVSAVLAPLGVRVSLVSRDPVRAASQFVPHLAAECRAYDDADIATVIALAALIVQATSLGMSPHHDTAPPLALTGVGPRHAVIDLVYNPWMTRFLRDAQAHGALTLNGWPMLVQQAARALEIWAGAGTGACLVAAAQLLEPRPPRL